MWWKKFRRVVLDLFPETNDVARVVFETPSLSGLDDARRLEWRVKRRGDGFTMLSLALTFPPRGADEGAQTFSFDFGPEAAGEIKAALDKCLAEYERIKLEPKY